MANAIWDWADVAAVGVIAREAPDCGIAWAAVTNGPRRRIIATALRRAYLDGQINQMRIAREAQDEPGLGPQEFVTHEEQEP